MPCPRCHAQLTPAQQGADVIHACGSCGGVWLPPHSAVRLLAPLPDFAPSHLGTPPLPCPQCGEPMHATYSPRAGVEVDGCSKHGVWFDHDEVTHLAQAIARLQGKPVPAVPGPGPRPAGTVAAMGGAAAAGVAVGGAAAALATADALSTPQGQRATDAVAAGAELAAELAIETAVHGPNLIDAGAEVAAMAGDAAGNLGDAAEVGAAVVEASGGVLASVLDVLGGLFS